MDEQYFGGDGTARRVYGEILGVFVCDYARHRRRWWRQGEVEDVLTCHRRTVLQYIDVVRGGKDASGQRRHLVLALDFQEHKLGKSWLEKPCSFTGHDARDRQTCFATRTQSSSSSSNLASMTSDIFQMVADLEGFETTRRGMHRNKWATNATRRLGGRWSLSYLSSSARCGQNLRIGIFGHVTVCGTREPRVSPEQSATCMQVRYWNIV